MRIQMVKTLPIDLLGLRVGIIRYAIIRYQIVRYPICPITLKQIKQNK